MLVSGIDPRRFDLSGTIMFKDSCITSNQSPRRLRARKEDGFALRLDVEVDEDEANEAIAAAADVVMLDNIEGSELTSVACRLREC
jgi:nicotinate-nucleotide pyrophosphorylase (carboxylating)